MHIFRLLIAILLSLVLLSSCSSGIQIGYRQLDQLIPAWLDRQITLTDEQKVLTRTAIGNMLDWHCRSELPNYAQWIEAVAHEYTAGMSIQLGEYRYGQMVTAWNRIVDKVAHSLAKLSGTFSDTQVDQVLAELDQRNADYFSNYLNHPQSTRRKIYAAWMTRTLERSIGRLTKDQTALVQEWAEQVDLLYPGLRETRLAARHKLAVLLSQRDQNHTLLNGIRTLLYEDRDADTDFDRRYRHNTRQALAMMAAVSQKLTQRQKKRLHWRASIIADASRDIDCEGLRHDSSAQTSP